jgi:Uncharacterized conserved protein
MHLENSFDVPVSIDDMWALLMDIRRVASCMPGASLKDVDGDVFSGSVKVKLGPIGLTYDGTARFVAKDESRRLATIEAEGRDRRGNGAARATVCATLSESSGMETHVTVLTDLDITGKPAQFGRGVISDVSARLIGQFAENLSKELTVPEPPTESLTLATDPIMVTRSVEISDNDAAISLSSLVGPVLVKRVAVPIMAAAGLLGIVLWLRARIRGLEARSPGSV